MSEKNSEIEPCVVENIILKAVPYQCCPLCNGTGQTIADGYVSTVYQICKVCNGARIIPMHVVDIDYTLKK